MPEDGKYATGPDIEEVYQHDEPEKAVAVEVSNVVRVDEMPTLLGGLRSRTVDTTAVRIANTDPRRKSLTLITLDEPLIVAASQNECQSGEYGFVLPENVPLPMTHQNEVWIRCRTDAQTTKVSILVEQWAP